MKGKVTHILLDLDHTLWDFETNAREALNELYEHHRLSDHSDAGSERFIEEYEKINRQLWKQYEAGAVTKEHLRVQRFVKAFGAIGIPESQVPETIWQEYLEICPLKTNLMPGAEEMLDALAGRFPLAIVSNGFEEVQQIKLRSSGIERYFQSVITSEKAGRQKPQPEIFLLAMNELGAASASTLMLGDNLETDIQGALNAGIWAVHYLPETFIVPENSFKPEPHYTISDLRDLIGLL